ncbi:MAG: protein-disulfide reductase DsbD family protein [Bryobacterales bacterium]|nr:protein-disulfide reductase DsbD family protein [Bryobacterales bacterium]
MAIAALICLSGWSLPGQTSRSASGGSQDREIAKVVIKSPAVAKRGQSLTIPVEVKVAKGFHVTSATPGDRYLKPLQISWDKGALVAEATRYPEAVLRSYPFAEGKLSVLEGAFVIEQQFRVPANATQGFGAITGKLRYQACTERECFAPATVPIQFSYDIR